MNLKKKCVCFFFVKLAISCCCSSYCIFSQWPTLKTEWTSFFYVSWHSSFVSAFVLNSCYVSKARPSLRPTTTTTFYYILVHTFPSSAPAASSFYLCSGRLDVFPSFSIAIVFLYLIVDDSRGRRTQIGRQVGGKRGEGEKIFYLSSPSGLPFLSPPHDSVMNKMSLPRKKR